MAFLACFILIPLVFPGADPQLPENSRAPAETAPEVTPKSVDFGAVGHHVKREFKFEIHNPGSAPLRVHSLKASCGCIDLKMDLRPIAPGESRTCNGEVSFGRGFHKFHKYVTVTFANEGVQPLRFDVHADFHPGIAPEGRKYSLAVEGAVEKNLPEAEDRVVFQRRPPTGKPLKLDHLRCADPHLSLQSKEISADRSVIIVCVLPTHPQGRINTTILATMEGLPVVLPVTGKVHRGIRAAPEYLNFSKIVDPNRELVARLEPLDGDPFQILEVVVIPGRARPGVIRGLVETKTRALDPVGFEIVAKVKQPLDPGARLQGKIIIRTDHPNCPELILHYMGFVPKRPPRDSR